MQTIKPAHYKVTESNLQFHSGLIAADTLHLGIVLYEGYDFVTADKTLSAIARAILFLLS